MATNKQQPEKPLWEVKVRPIGEAQSPWETVEVRAKSIIQAEAIMRRRGFEMATTSTLRADGQPIPVPERDYAYQPLKCSRCGYSLEGLVLDRASVTCTECSFVQPLIAHIPENSGFLDRSHPLIGVFAIVGIIATVLFVLLLTLPIVDAVV